MEDMSESERIEAAKIRDRAAAAAQGDRSAWEHLFSVMAAPDARLKALEAQNATLRAQLASIICPHCGKPIHG